MSFNKRAMEEEEERGYSIPRSELAVCGPHVADDYLREDSRRTVRFRSRCGPLRTVPSSRCSKPAALRPPVVRGRPGRRAQPEAPFFTSRTEPIAPRPLSCRRMG